MSGDTRFYTLSTTVRQPEEGRALARALVRERLAACVQSRPIESVYWWQGKIETEAEILLQAKTTADRLEAAMALIRSKHSYELPEIVACPIEAGDPEYLEWIRRETQAL